MSAMAFYGFLIYLTLVLKSSRRVKAVVIAVLIFIIACVGLSRIYLGVHYPTDVAAGWMAGLIWALLCTFAARRLQRKGHVERSGLPDTTDKDNDLSESLPTS